MTTGWLIERPALFPFEYLALDDGPVWTNDPNRAIRLSRREDAYDLARLIEMVHPAFFDRPPHVREHAWY